MSTSSPSENVVSSTALPVEPTADAALHAKIDAEIDTMMPAILIAAGNDARAGAIASQEIVNRRLAEEMTAAAATFGTWLLANQGSLPPDFDLDI